MVNYCCVLGCSRNSRIHKHLNFYSLPKEKHRQKLWLQLASRNDLLNKDMDRLRKSLRFCSRHFQPETVLSRNLSQDAVPSKSLPGSVEADEPDVGSERHDGIICDSCQYNIMGFRYKCVTCDNYDLCQKCEMLERHPQHYMLRIPKSIQFQIADNLINKWQHLFKKEHILPDCDSSSDDEPVTKYIRYDSGIDLTENVKTDIQNEVTKALKATKEALLNSTTTPTKDITDKIEIEKTPIKRKENVVKIVEYKKVKVDEVQPVPEEETIEAVKSIQTQPELVFADVDTLKFDEADIKPTVPDMSHAVAVPNTFGMTVETQPILYVTLNNDLSQFMIELAPDNNTGTMK